MAVGCSAGGYGAMVFGTLLGVEKVLSFGPQTTVDLEILAELDDHRWDEPLRELHAAGAIDPDWSDLREALPRARWADTRYEIYYSSVNSRPKKKPGPGLDRRQAERLRGLEGTRLYRFGAGGHSIARLLRENGALDKILRRALLEPPGTEPRSAAGAGAGALARGLRRRVRTWPAARPRPGAPAASGRAGPPAGSGRRGERLGAHAAALDAGGPSGSARPCRPPSRRRGRPRAAGTSGSGGGHRARAGRGLMFAVTGTCVRKAREEVGRTGANRCTHSLPTPQSAWPCGFRCARCLQRMLHGPARAGGAWAGCGAGRAARGRRELER